MKPFLMMLAVVLLFTTCTGETGKTAATNGTTTNAQKSVSAPVAASTNVQGKLFVLCYHTFYANKKTDYNFAPDEFRSQILKIKELGYRFVDFYDVMSNRITGDSNVLLTIDDGNITVMDIVELLKEMNIKPVLFITTAVVNKDKRMMTYENHKQLLSNGYFIGAHGYYHEILFQKFYDKHPDRFMQEIYAPKKMLETNLNIRVDVEAYPHGAFSPLAITNFQKAGFLYCFTINWGTVLLPLHINKKPYELPRYMITPGSWNVVYKVLAKNAAGFKK